MTGIPFEHGVASFDPDASSVLIWTRVAHDGSVRWHLATDPALEHLVRSGTAEASSETDRCVTIDVDGLEPATTYFYGFEMDEERSLVGRTRTLPAGPVDRFRMGVTCCADYSAAPLGVYRALAEREVDVVLHLHDDQWDGYTAERERVDAADRGPWRVRRVDRARVQFEWWAVDPYADDPGGESECPTVRALPHGRRPCRFDDVDEPSADPKRIDIPSVPARPDDLVAVRVKRFARLFSKTVALASVPVAAAIVRRLRQRQS